MGTGAAILRQWWAPRRWCAALSRMFQGGDSHLSDKNTGVAKVGHPEAQKERKHPFDRAHGVDTGGLLYADAAADGHASAHHNAGYYATAPSLFHGAMELWGGTLPGTGYTIEDYSLVDIGCGKGRVLMLASGYAFREIVGVELNPRLARVAQKNLRRWMIQARARSLVRIIEADALAAPLPDGPVALFYFNSFERPMMEMWLARLGEIGRERRAPLDLIYIHPEFDALIRQSPGMRTLAEAEIPLSDEDAAADAFGVAEDRCAIYRSQPIIENDRLG